MGIITRLIPHYTQPQEAARVDRSNPLARGHILTVSPAVGEITIPVGPAYYGTATQAVSGKGKTYYADDSANDAVAIVAPASHPLYAITTICTVSIWIDVSSSADYANYFSVPYRQAGWTSPYNSLVAYKHTGSTNKTAFQWAESATTSRTALFSTAVVTTGYANYTFVRNGASASIYKNGVLVETVSVAANNNVDWGEKRPVVLLNSTESSLPNGGWTGHHHGLDIWNRALDANEIKRYFDNRWQILTPRKRQIYVNTVSGVTLAVADVAHAHSLDAVSFTQAHNLAQADIAHGHTLDAVSLTQTHNLVQADIAHAHTLETIALSQTHNLTQADVAHAHVVDAASVTQAHNLAQADVAHGHTLDNVVLNVDTTLAVADVVHGHTVEAVTLTQTHNLAQADVSHAHSLDSIALTQAHSLVQADVVHAHTAEAVTLTVGGITLSLDIVLHSHTLDNVNLTQAHNLSLVDLAHVHTLDNVIFTFDGVQLSALRQMYSNSQVSRRSNNQASRRSNKQTARRP